jgi:hypothetical protein
MLRFFKIEVLTSQIVFHDFDKTAVARLRILQYVVRG